jgi:hypothetical protein
MTTDETRAERTRYQRLRRMAERQGLQLRKSRRRDPRALDFGDYWLTAGDDLVPHSRGRGLDHIEEILTGERKDR